MEKLAKYEFIIISDADVRAPADLLSNVVAQLEGVSWERRHSAGESDEITSIAVAPPANSTATSPASARPSHFAPLTSPTPLPSIGLVNCFYSLANPATLAMRWEAIAINADFWSQVLQAQSLKPVDF